MASRQILEIHFREFIEAIAKLQALPPAKIVLLAVVMLLTYVVTCFVFKSLLLQTLRILGLYSPNLYSALPSAIPLIRWRSIYLLKMAFNRWHDILFKTGKRASGGFSSPLATMTLLYKNPAKQIPLGRVWCWGLPLSQQIVALDVDKHFCVVGATGAGKSVLIKAIIASYQGSIFLIDAKNEMEDSLKRQDKRRKWVCLKPYSLDTSDQINPFDVVTMVFQQYGESFAIRAAYVIATSLIETNPDAKQPYFTQASAGMLSGLILFVVAHFPQEYHTLGFVRTLIIKGLEVYNDDGTPVYTPDEAKDLLYQTMRESTAFSGAIIGAASVFINASNETRGNLESTLAERTRIFDIEGVRYITNATTRPLSELKTCDDYVLSIGASVQSIRGELKDLFKMYLNIILFVFEVTPQKKGQTLLLAEEFNAQGYNSVFEAALPVIRSMGLNAGIIIQDVESLRAAYKSTYRAFMGNASFVVWLATNHLDNLNEIHQILGKTSYINTDRRTGKRSILEADVSTPQQIAHFLSPDSGNTIVTRMGKRALRLKVLQHYKDMPVSSYMPDPHHKEPVLRKLSRLIFNPSSLFKQ